MTVRFTIALLNVMRDEVLIDKAQSKNTMLCSVFKTYTNCKGCPLSAQFDKPGCVKYLSKSRAILNTPDKYSGKLVNRAAKIRAAFYLKVLRYLEECVGNMYKMSDDWKYHDWRNDYWYERLAVKDCGLFERSK